MLLEIDRCANIPIGFNPMGHLHIRICLNMCYNVIMNKNMEIHDYYTAFYMEG